MSLPVEELGASVVSNGELVVSEGFDGEAENESIVIFNLFSSVRFLSLRISIKPLPSNTCVRFVPLIMDVAVT